jgi:hypothetical protein
MFNGQKAWNLKKKMSQQVTFDIDNQKWYKIMYIF